MKGKNDMKKLLSLFMGLVMAMSLVCGIPVSAAEPAVKLAYDTITVTKGKSVTLKATVSGTSDYTLVWSTSDKTVASVTSSGKVTGLKNGTADITVKIKGTDASDKVKVTVGKKVTGVSVKESEISLKPKATYSISASVSPSDASNKKLSYSSSNSKIAKVNSKGEITAVKNGTAKITVKSTDGTGKKAVITVTVSSKAASSSSKKNTSAKTTGSFNKDITAAELTADMKIGWNLGNSLDALGNGVGSETAWGNPKTTKKMIDDIKAAGFNTVRIPVSWGRHTDKAGTVDAAWMARVKEVVDYAYDNGMYVILNSHHDNEYYDIGGCVESEDTYKKSEEKMTKLWTQISKTFKKYDHRLIFEAMNEPRTEGSPKEWTGGTVAEREIVYKLNDAITQAIRKTGGNNAYRYIMVPAYAATSSMGVLRTMKLPDDDRIIVSVHAYSPYNYAMNAGYSKNFSDSDRKELDKFFSDLNDVFVSKGISVVIGEFGATNKGDEADRCLWAEYFVKGAKKYGITCVWWDNNSKTSEGGECFGLYNRNTGEWVFKDLLKTLIDAAK